MTQKFFAAFLLLLPFLRLDKVLGSSKSPDCYDSSNISLASRVVKVEAQIESVDMKITQFLNNYTLDMRMLMDKLDQRNGSNPNSNHNNVEARRKPLLSDMSSKVAYSFDKVEYPLNLGGDFDVVVIICRS